MSCWKLIGSNYGHFPYHLGANSLAETHETFDPVPCCGPGGLYFTDIEHILEYLECGDKICEIRIPGDAQVVCVEGTKYKADKIEILSIDPLLDRLVTLENQGLNVHVHDDYALKTSAELGRLDMVKFLIEECGANPHTGEEEPLIWAAGEGQLEVVKYLVEEHHADIHAQNDEALIRSAGEGYLEVVKYLVERGAAINEEALKVSAHSGWLGVVKYLVEQGAIPTKEDLIRSADFLEVVEYLRGVIE